MKDKELLEEFIEWAKDCGEDAWYIFDHTDEAIELLDENVQSAFTRGKFEVSNIKDK